MADNDPIIDDLIAYLNSGTDVPRVYAGLMSDGKYHAALFKPVPAIGLAFSGKGTGATQEEAFAAAAKEVEQRQLEYENRNTNRNS